MSFDYDKIKEKHENQSYWASSSDLFMVLSLVFLLLYVVAGLKSSTYSIQKNAEYKRVMELNADLKEQLKVYNTVQEDYLKEEASNEEVKVYENLMSKLDLLQEEADQEKKDLRKKANELQKKEQALNKYQQLVRNIINSNMMAKTTITRRDKQIKKVKSDFSELEIKFKDVAEKMKEVASDLKANERKLAIQNRKNEELLADMELKKQQYEQELEAKKENYEKQVAEIQQDFKSKAKAERKAYEKKLKKQKMSAKAREKAMRKFQNEQDKKYKTQIASVSKELNEKIKDLDGQYKEKLTDLNQEFDKKVKNLSSKVEDKNKALAKAQERLNARKKVAKKIQKNFKKAGIDASVDPNTGDVILNFKGEYFDTGKYTLKKNMKKILKDSIPVYAKSLFQDKKIADKISFVEIVGFASPTFGGKYIDPQSMDAKDRKAIEYNLDLSYKRAKSIFKNIFNKKEMSFAQQKKLQGLVKVTGRSFLAEKVSKDGRGIASGMSQKEFCKLYDCKKAQRVIIKFDLEN